MIYKAMSPSTMVYADFFERLFMVLSSDIFLLQIYHPDICARKNIFFIRYFSFLSIKKAPTIYEYIVRLWSKLGFPTVSCVFLRHLFAGWRWFLFEPSFGLFVVFFLVFVFGWVASRWYALLYLPWGFSYWWEMYRNSRRYYTKKSQLSREKKISFLFRHIIGFPIFYPWLFLKIRTI